MTYIVSAHLRVEPDDFWPSNRMQRVPPRKFPTLSAAKQHADMLIEKLPDAGIIIEVSERNGRQSTALSETVSAESNGYRWSKA